MVHPAPDNGKFDPDFGFADPMLAIHWTLWQALAWITGRDANSVMECAGVSWDVGRVRRKIWRENNCQVNKARRAPAKVRKRGARGNWRDIRRKAARDRADGMV